MTVTRLFSDAIFTAKVGGAETLRNPPRFACSDQTHEPFYLRSVPAVLPDVNERFLWGVVRTTGWQYDGDRSDVHDIFSLIWAAFIRAFGLGSPWLIDEGHGFVPGEMGARHVIIQQCPWKLDNESDFDAARKAMNAWSAFGFHLLDNVFTWGRGINLYRSNQVLFDDPDKPSWKNDVVSHLEHPDDIIVNHRTRPLWIYISSYDAGVSIVRMPRVRIAFLKTILSPFHASATKVDDALALFANGIPNAIPLKTISEARKILNLSNDKCADPLVLPIDSHCIVVGDKTIVAIRDICGRELYELKRESALERRAYEDEVFFANSVVKWKQPLDAGLFEELSLELLRREPGVIRAKLVGGVNDRDGGRDIIIDWLVPESHENIGVETMSKEDIQGIHAGRSKSIRVIAQVKSRSKTVGKSDVQDVRDTLEHHRADAFLLIAHPRISTALVDYIEGLRERTCHFTDWLDAKDIEERLRRHPDLARRYPSLIDLQTECSR